MTIYDDMRGYVHTHDRNGWFDVVAETTPMYQMIDKADAENAKLRELIQKTWKWEKNGCYECPLEKDCKVLCVYDGDCGVAVEIEKELQELGIEVKDD